MLLLMHCIVLTSRTITFRLCCCLSNARSAQGLSRHHSDYVDECVCSDINQLLFVQAGRCCIYLSDIHSVMGVCPICFVSNEYEWARGVLVYLACLIR